MPSGAVNGFMHLLAPGGCVAKGKYHSFSPGLDEPAPGREPRAAPLRPYGHRLPAARGPGKGPTDVRPPYGSFLIWDGVVFFSPANTLNKNKRCRGLTGLSGLIR